MREFSDVSDVGGMIIWFGLMIGALGIVLLAIKLFGPPIPQAGAEVRMNSVVRADQVSAVRSQHLITAPFGPWVTLPSSDLKLSDPAELSPAHCERQMRFQFAAETSGPLSAWDNFGSPDATAHEPSVDLSLPITTDTN